MNFRDCKGYDLAVGDCVLWRGKICQVIWQVDSKEKSFGRISLGGLGVLVPRGDKFSYLRYWEDFPELCRQFDWMVRRQHNLDWIYPWDVEKLFDITMEV